MRTFIVAIVMLLGVTMLGVAGCERNGNIVATTGGADSSGQSDALPASLIAATQPSGPVLDVTAAKESAKQGDRVLVRGRIGAQKEPLAKNRAILTLADQSLTTCDKSPMKECDTPWDSCCQPAEERSAKS